MEDLIPFTLFGSGIAFGIALMVVFILLVIGDLNESGWFASLIMFIALVVNYFWGTFPTFEFITLKNVGMYLFLGFLFSIVRTYFKGKELDEDSKKYFNLKEHVFRWWFLFPIALLNWVFGTILKDLYNLLYGKLELLYVKLFNM